jgi:hypothetical protein
MPRSRRPEPVTGRVPAAAVVAVVALTVGPVVVGVVAAVVGEVVVAGPLEVVVV